MSQVLKDRYTSEVAPALMKNLNLGNAMEIPRITKVVVNIGLERLWTTPKRWMLLSLT